MSKVVFLYCDYGIKDQQTVNGLLAALLRQIAQGDSPTPDSILGLHKICKKEQRRPSLEELNNTLVSVAKGCNQTFLVVDALDECSKDAREKLISSIRRLQKEVSICFLATSRPIPGIEKLFQGNTRLGIRASENDIEIFLQSRLQDLPDWTREDASLQEEIKHSIAEAVEGMYVFEPHEVL